MTIRVKAVAILRHEGRVLVERGYDRVAGSAFYRAIGGHVEFGERAADAAAREWMEEYGRRVEDLRLLGVVENRFTFEGHPGHEVVFAYDARAVDADVYAREEIDGMDPGGKRHQAVWVSLADLAEGGPLLSPEGLLALLMPPA